MRTCWQEASSSMGSLTYRRFFAWMLHRAGDHPDERVIEHKRRLLGALAGVVVEIGPGAGANLPYYLGVDRVVGLEPNPFMHRYLREAAEAQGLELGIIDGRAERIPLETNSADAVVSTLVLCSVVDVASTLSEVLRVLKPGGRFVFVEHVAAPEGGWLRRVQGWVSPLWRRLGEGCRPDRETWKAIDAAGFEAVEYVHMEARPSLPLVRPHLVGSARKPSRRPAMAHDAVGDARAVRSTE